MQREFTTQGLIKTPRREVTWAANETRDFPSPRFFIPNSTLTPSPTILRHHTSSASSITTQKPSKTSSSKTSFPSPCAPATPAAPSSRLTRQGQLPTQASTHLCLSPTITGAPSQFTKKVAQRNVSFRKTITQPSIPHSSPHKVRNC